MTADSGLMPDLTTWQEWSRGHRRSTALLRRAKAAVRPHPEAERVLLVPTGDIRTVVVVDKRSPSCDAAVARPLRHLDQTHTAVVAWAGDGVERLMPSSSESVRYEGPEQLGADVRAVLSLGSYLGLSEPLEPWARRHDIPFHLVQHGLLTPWSPPASEGSTVLAWSDSDEAYWSAGRTDVTVHVVGSQLLHEVAQQPRTPLGSDRPVMLGQLHGDELSRVESLRAYERYCRGEGFRYRPHPNESDAVSRALHTVMRRSGIEFDRSGRPLADLGSPVVSIFSTGTLEAAVRGLPAWVAHPSPPAWVRDFWQRYGLAEWGGEPTAAWTMPSLEPAQRIASIVEGAA